MLKNSLPELCCFSFLKALNFLSYACRLFLHDQLQEEKKYFKHYGSVLELIKTNQLTKKCDGGKFPLKSPFISKSGKLLGGLFVCF